MTIPQLFFAQAKKYGHRILFQVKREGRYHPITWSATAEQVEGIALGLLELGLRPGDRVAILSENRPEWAYADLAILSIGAATVPIYTTLGPPEIEHILRDSGAQWIFVSTPELLAKVLTIAQLPDLKIVLFDAPYWVMGPKIFWMGELIGFGKAAGAAHRQLWENCLGEEKADTLASIIYTSGTTGPSKGVMLTHGNFLSNAQAIQQILPISESDQTLSFLPLSHVFERTAGYYFVLLVGGRIAYAESVEKAADNLREIAPTIVTAVPRFYEKFYEKVQEGIAVARGIKKRIAHWAFPVGKRRAQRILDRKTVPPFLALEYWLADRLVFSHLRERLGGRIRFFVSGGAPLSKELAEFFYSAGILILEGYGLTETSPVIAVNRPGQFRFGTVGLPLPGVEVTIAQDGEILTRGPHVMRGYWNHPAATAEVIDAERWFHTGDVGSIDADSFLTITDRKKDLIKTSGGKLVAPQNLENALRNDPSIEDAMVIGDRRKYITALIVPGAARLAAFAKKEGIAGSPKELVGEPRVVEWMWEKVEKVNQHLAHFEQIKKITLLADPFTAVGGELTPTLKVKRKVVAQRYQSQIEAMYKEE